MKLLKHLSREARATLRWLATGRLHSRQGEQALLRYYAGPDAERDRENTGRPGPTR